MNPLVPHYRRWTRRLRNLAGHLHLDARANHIVRRTDFTHCPRPVLLLYGFFSTRRVFEVLEQRLRRDGYSVWSIHLGGALDRFNTCGIDALARKVREKVERMYTRYPHMGPLSIVGHSKGGLIGMYYVKRLGGDARVRNLITLGTPHKGSRLAYLGCATLGWFSRSMWQLTPVSPFLKQLRMGAFPRNVRLTSLYSKMDEVTPWASARLDVEGQPQVFNHELPDVGHGELLTRRAVYEVIRRELVAGYGECAQGLRAVSLPPSAS
ncbi:permease [Myxococcus llanfairpwllgwyngyllgogerychwyrndrobwllllantysiliogogogochensis]|uniref:Permease n=1 Tax=Myxococcus llanfairpwllgwyngyllgogerychwyrndrobwllllantysiliogogogochensis TaxID=2590453 RepID=A0A540WV81_9BACT|nr:permease [Myxococcus llanfairpwllgwyngyllgogerychwyrndrobwllllantysiliogogogochensis]TQF12344.1 permease [Myxococcus llanfairpwllgwyngyllgogerychwyrndrobwllllantysiliogogogochensis]